MDNEIQSVESKQESASEGEELFGAPQTGDMGNNVMETLENDQDFQRLLPEYEEYSEHPTKVEVPLVHGTGSMALQSILREGFMPGGGDISLHGEAASRPRGEKDSSSFATGNAEGEIISHWYALEQARNTELSFDATKYIGDRTMYMVDSVYGGLENIKKQTLAEFSFETEEQRELAEAEVEASLQSKLKAKMESSGANLFTPERAKQMIASTDILLNGMLNPGKEEDVDTAVEIFRSLYLLEDLIMNDHETHSRIRPDKTKEMVKKTLKDISDPSDWMRGQVETMRSELVKKMSAFESLPVEGKNELQNQFPCYIVLEGKGLDTEGSDWMKGEVHIEGVVTPTAIREVQVPETKIPEVTEWVRKAGLEGVRIVPFEFYEMKEALEATKKAV